MTEMNHYLVDGISPEPWTAPEASVGRSGGKVYPRFHKNAGLTAYQEAIKEHLIEHYSVEVRKPDDERPLGLNLYFWRQLTTTDAGTKTKSRKHQADATNMQKATEDAIQGVLFKNDRQVVEVSSIIVAQGPDVTPQVLIQVLRNHRLGDVSWLDLLIQKAKDAMQKVVGPIPRPVRERPNPLEFF